MRKQIWENKLKKTKQYHILFNTTLIYTYFENIPITGKSFI